MAFSATRFRPNTANASDGSRTITIHDSQPREEEPEDSDSGGVEGSAGTLRLRGGPRKKSKRKVVWDDDVVDNEGCGRKSSKICCIYHKPKQFDESSDESDTDSDSDCGHDHRNGRHNHSDHSDDGALRGSPDNGAIGTVEESDEPNAYEIMPSKKGKKKAP
jgi:protein phosphatase 1 regulatory subunit 11